MAAWHESKPQVSSGANYRAPVIVFDHTRKRRPRSFGAGLAFGLYLGAILWLVGFVVWKVAHPLPGLLP